MGFVWTFFLGYANDLDSDSDFLVTDVPMDTFKETLIDVRLCQSEFGCW